MPLPQQHLVPQPVPIEIPPGYGFNLIPPERWHTAAEEDHPDYLESLMDKLLLWEVRRKGRTYVISVDVSSGLGLDRSVIDVLRVGTLTEPEEQVAQFVSDSVDPIELAYFIDPIGRFYHDDDDLGALVAVECNGQGLATQSELQHHCGYDNLYIWQHEDARDPRSRYTKAYGWYTTARTRARMLARYFRAVTAVDPRTGLPDYRINSPFTMEEMRDFVSTGAAWEAEASSGAHDDCLMAGAISVEVATQTRLLESEPLSEQRRRLAEEQVRREAMQSETGTRRDFQNSDISEHEVSGRPDPYAPQGGWY
jgi:hypothetical protein